MKGEISVCTDIVLNDHSNLYIKSTTALSDSIIIMKYHAFIILPAHSWL